MSNNLVRRIIDTTRFQYLKTTNPQFFVNKMTINLKSTNELSKIFEFNKKPILGENNLYKYVYPEDVNDRKLKDATVIATVVRNIKPATCVEIGTALGITTSLISINAPKSTVYTVNILPEETEGDFITKKYTKSEIGKYYRSQKLRNVNQVFSDSRKWHPPTKVDFAYIDGCHDMDFVISDTQNIINKMKPGGFIIWHDFSPEHIEKHEWVKDVCKAIEVLYRKGVLTDYIYHVEDSWSGVYKIPK